MVDAGLGNSIFAAMGQSFFTLSIGIGALAIFGSYIGKERRLTGEASVSPFWIHWLHLWLV